MKHPRGSPFHNTCSPSWKFLAAASSSYSVEYPFPVDTGRKLNVHKTFIGRPGRLLNILRMLNLHPVTAGLAPASEEKNSTMEATLGALKIRKATVCRSVNF